MKAKDVRNPLVDAVFALLESRGMMNVNDSHNFAETTDWLGDTLEAANAMDVWEFVTYHLDEPIAVLWFEKSILFPVVRSRRHLSQKWQRILFHLRRTNLVKLIEKRQRGFGDSVFGFQGWDFLSMCELFYDVLFWEPSKDWTAHAQEAALMSWSLWRMDGEYEPGTGRLETQFGAPMDPCLQGRADAMIHQYPIILQCPNKRVFTAHQHYLTVNSNLD